jgi:hypothetical protein
VAADGGDFDATKPGAAKEADRKSYIQKWDGFKRPLTSAQASWRRRESIMR